MPKKPRPIPGRPTIAPGVPTPVSWGGPSQSLSKMATQIGSNRALSEFYKVMVESQLEYDQDEHEFGLTRLQDNRRNRQERNMVNLRDDNATELSQLRAQQEIDVANHKEYLKGDKGSGLGVKSTSSNPLGLSETELAAEVITAKKRPGSVWDIVTGVNTEGVDPEKTKVETVVEAKTKLAASKKEASDEAESKWWGGFAQGVKENVSTWDDTLDDSFGVPSFMEGGTKAVGGAIGGGAKAAWNSPVGDATKDVGKTAFDLISRPLHAAAGATSAQGALNEDQNSANPTSLKDIAYGLAGGPLLGPLSMLSGYNPMDSIDEMLSNPGRAVSDIASGGWQGFKGEDKKSFIDVMRENAERDENFSIHDTKTAQYMVGLGGDLFLDPLNAAGVGMFVKPVRALKEAGNIKRVRGLADEAVAMGVQRPKTGIGPDIALGADEITRMLSGKYHTKAERIADAGRISRNANLLSEEIARVNPGTKTLSRMGKLEAEATKIQAKIKASVDEAVASTLVDDVVGDFVARENAGSAPVGTAKRIEEAIHDSRINSAFEAAVKTKRTYGKGVRGDKDKMRAVRQEEFEKTMGEGYVAALPAVDRKAIFDATFTLRGLAKHPDPSIAKIGNAQIQNAHALTAAKRTKNKERIAEAEAVVAKGNVQIDKLRPLVFRQMFDAKVKKSAGETVYSDPDRAAVLQQIRDKAEADLRARNIEPYELGTKRGIEHDTNFDGREGSALGTSNDEGLAGAAGKKLKNAAGNAPESGRKLKGSWKHEDASAPQQGPRDTHTREADELDGDPTLNEFPEPDLTDSVGAFETDTRFHNQEAQLSAIFTKADAELRALESEYGDLDVTKLEVPESLQGVDGKIDKQKLATAFVADPDGPGLQLKAAVQGSPEEAWLLAARERMNLLAEAQYKRLNHDDVSRLKEAEQTKVTTRLTVDDLNAKVKLKGEEGDTARLALKMFAPTGDSSKLKGTDWLDKHFAPKVTVDGKAIHRTKRAELAEHVKAPDKKASERMKRYLVDPSKVNHAQKSWVLDQLAGHDIGVVSTLKGVQDYLERHRDVLVGNFTPEQFAFKRMFENEHGMALGDAMNVRAKVLGNYVQTPSKKWSKRFPNGISKGEFVRAITYAATKDTDNVIDMITDGFPGYITRGKVKQAGLSGEKSAKNVEGTSVSSQPFSGSKGSGSTLPGWKYIFEQSDEVVNEALRRVNLPVGSSLEDVRKVWIKDFKDYIKTSDPEDVRLHLSSVWTDGMKKSKHFETKRKREFVEENPKAYENEVDYPANRVKARKYAVDEVISQANRGHSVTQDSGYLRLPAREGTTEVVEKAVKTVADEGIETARKELAVAKTAGSTPYEIKALENKLQSLRDEWKAEKALLGEKAAAAAEMGVLLQKRIQEEALISIASASIQTGSKKLSLNLFNQSVDIKGSEAMFKAAEKAAGVIGIRRFANFYKEAFASQRGLLDEDAALIANRALSNTSEVISYHIRDIKKTLGNVPYRQRQATFRGLLTGTRSGEDEVQEMLVKHFDGLLPYFKGNVPLGGKDEFLSMYEVNRFLPDKLKFETRGINGVKIETSHQLAEALVANIKRNSGAKAAKDIDPIEIIWGTRIATEQAMARHALVKSINETFGIKRPARVSYKDGNPTDLKNSTPEAQAIEELRKQHGWTSHKEFGHKYLFPPESAEDIKRLMDMFNPRDIGRVGKFVDEVTGIWKTSVTIYNVPGYYVRNGIGESMSAFLGGVHNPAVFRRGHNVLRFYKHEGAEVEALRDHMPALAHMMKGETHSEIGKKIAARRSNGTELSTEKVGVLYRDQGLSSGFINTEYRHHYSKGKEKMRNLPGVKRAGKMNDGLRQKNESIEDFYRMGHFIDKLEKAPRNLSDEAAAIWAAKEVRKYHFDYTDFSNIEKTYMLRAFPFYKWTRKALPLMSSMLFLKPGKMNAFPKIMDATSESLTSDDLSGSEPGDGFMPTYSGYAPPYLQDMWAYQIGEQQFGRVATPQLDSMNQASNPASAAMALANPLFKNPVEQVLGQTIGNMPFDVQTKHERIDNIAGITPQSRELNNLAKKLGFGSEEDAARVMNPDDLIRLATGLGYYDQRKKD